METHNTREPLTDSERATFEGYAAAIFSRMGMKLDTPGTHETPRRWLTALWDMTEGYDGDSKLSTLFPVECPVCPDEEKTHIVEGPIRFTGLCEHHVLPIRGSGRLPAVRPNAHAQASSPTCNSPRVRHRGSLCAQREATSQPSLSAL